MTWASKLFEKMISPRDAWEEVPYEDVDDEANKEYLLKEGYLISAVLEKEKEIEKSEPNFDNGYMRAEARAFRKLVEKCKEVQGE